MFAKYGVPIDSIKGRNTAIQPKQSFKFRVRLLSFGGLENSASYGMDITQQVISVQKPSISFPKIDVPTYGGKYKTFNMPILNGLRLTLRDDIGNNILFAINSQIQKQYDFDNGRYAVAGSNAKFTLLIETLDGENDIRSIDTWRLDGCFIENIEYGSHQYSAGDPVEISMNIEFDEINDHYTESDGAEEPLSSLWYVMSKATDNI